MEPYEAEKRTPEEIATLLAANVLVERPEIMNSAGGCPTTFSGRQGTYLVDTKTLADVKDLRVDGYGAWGRKNYYGGFYYDINDDRTTTTRIKQTWQEVNRKKVPDKYDFAVKFERYSNASSGNHLKKTLYRVIDSKDAAVGSLAAVQFEWDTEPFDFDIRSHGNAKRYQPYQPTKPSVMSEMRTQVKMKSPAQVQKSMLAGASDVASSFQQPRSYKQVDNMRQRTSGSFRMGRHGPQADTSYEEVLKLMATDLGVRDVDSCTLGGTNDIDIRCFVATDEQLNLFRRSCFNADPKLNRPLMIDSTYDTTDGYLTLFCVRNAMFESTKDGKEPLQIVAFGLSMREHSDSYKYLASKLAETSGVNDRSVQCWISDDGGALIKGLQLTNLFCPENAAHCLCEVHLRQNLDAKLRRYGVLSDNQRQQILSDVFGSEIQHESGRVRKGGLVDLPLEEFEMAVASEFGPKWDNMIGSATLDGDSFAAWFTKYKAPRLMQCYNTRVRSLATGVDKPGRVTNNAVETTNRYIKETALNRHQEPWQKVIPAVAEYSQRTFDQLKQAMHGCGDFRLKEAFRGEFQVEQGLWNRMSQVERQQHLKKLFVKVEIDMQTTIDWKLPLNPDDVIFLPTLAAPEIRVMMQKANKIVCDMDRLIVANPLHENRFTVFDEQIGRGNGVAVQREEAGSYECCSYCPTFSNFRKMICEHVIAVSLKHNDLFELIEKTNNKLNQEKASAALRSVNNGVSAGRKGGSRRGVNPSTGPTGVTDVVPPQTATTQIVSSIDKPTPLQRGRLMERRSATYTRPFHNDNRFVIYKTAEYFKQHPTQMSRCVECRIAIPRSGAGVGDDLLISHEESFAFPDKNNPPAFVWSTNTTRSAVIHARYGCMTQRYPYFHRALLDVAPSQDLNATHFKYLFEQLGYEKE